MVATIRLHLGERLQWNCEQMPPNDQNASDYPFDDLPLNARIAITVPPREVDPTPENLTTIQTVVHVRRNIPQTPETKVLYFILEKDLTMRLVVLTEAEMEAMKRSGTRPD